MKKPLLNRVAKTIALAATASMLLGVIEGHTDFNFSKAYSQKTQANLGYFTKQSVFKTASEINNYSSGNIVSRVVWRFE